MAISEHYARELINRALPIWIDIHTNDRGYYEKKRSLLCALKRRCLDEAMAAYHSRMDKSTVKREVPAIVETKKEPTVVTMPIEPDVEIREGGIAFADSSGILVGGVKLENEVGDGMIYDDDDEEDLLVLYKGAEEAENDHVSRGPDTSYTGEEDGA